MFRETLCALVVASSSACAHVQLFPSSIPSDYVDPSYAAFLDMVKTGRYTQFEGGSAQFQIEGHNEVLDQLVVVRYIINANRTQLHQIGIDNGATGGDYLEFAFGAQATNLGRELEAEVLHLIDGPGLDRSVNIVLASNLETQPNGRKLIRNRVYFVGQNDAYRPETAYLLRIAMENTDFTAER